LKQTQGNVCFTDLFGLSVLAIKAPMVYKHIKETPAAYIGRNFGEDLEIENPSDIVSNHQKQRKDVLEKISSKDKGHVEEILKHIFPLLNDESDGSSDNDYDKVGRIASPKRLYTALHYQIPTGYAADKDIVAFIRGEINRTEYVQKSIQEDFVKRFFELLYQNTDKISDENIFGILVSIYDVFLYSKYLEQTENGVLLLLNFNPFRSIWWITKDLIEKSENKTELILELIAKKEYVIITADIMRILLEQYSEIEPSGGKNNEEKWLDVENHKEAKSSWVTVAEQVISDESLLNSTFAAHVYSILRRADPDRTACLLSDLLNRENGIEKIARLIGRSGRDTKNGPYAYIDKSSFPEIVDFSLFVDAASEELKSGKDIEPEFKAVYLSIVSGDKYYLRDCSKGDNF